MQCLKNIFVFCVAVAIFVDAQASWIYDHRTEDVNIVREFYEDKYHFDSTSYPFSAVGLLFADSGGEGSQGTCTTFLVGPRELLTSAHCVINSTTKKFKTGFLISFNPFTKRRTGEIYGIELLFGGWSLDQDELDRKNDWFLLRTKKPLGERFGWLGLKDSRGRTTSPNKSIQQHTLNELDPKWMKTSSNVLSNFKNLKEPWLLTDEFLDKNYNSTMTVLLAYMLATRLDFILDSGWNSQSPLSISYNCHIRGVQKEILVNDCSSSKGSSGGPYLEIDQNKQPYVIAVMSESHRALRFALRFKKNHQIYLKLKELTSLVANNNQYSPEADALIEELKKKVVGTEKPLADIKRPLTSESLALLRLEYLQNMKWAESSLDRFWYPVNNEPEETVIRRNHYNKAVSTDIFFDKVSNYLRSEYPGRF